MSPWWRLFSQLECLVKSLTLERNSQCTPWKFSPCFSSSPRSSFVDCCLKIRGTKPFHTIFIMFNLILLTTLGGTSNYHFTDEKSNKGQVLQSCVAKKWWHWGSNPGFLTRFCPLLLCPGCPCFGVAHPLYKALLSDWSWGRGGKLSLGGG